MVYRYHIGVKIIVLIHFKFIILTWLVATRGKIATRYHYFSSLFL